MPLRALCIGIILLVAEIVSRIVIAGLPQEELDNVPLKGWRKFLRGSLFYLGKALRICCGFHYVKTTGKRATIDEARVFVVAPHSTFFDFLMVSETGLPCVVSRLENKDVLVLGSLLRALQAVLVQR